ncbi:MAG: PBSX family phage terminase large subunit [Clostridiales bacterium]|nr:PBSX family phage terminase large subunit [Clostridiales bacterium]
MKPFPARVVESMKETGFLTVWEGAVRSGKTTVSLGAWLKYVLNSRERVFLMSGYTMGSLMRNCVNNEFGFLAMAPGSRLLRDKGGNEVLKWFDKTIYCFGSDNAVSFRRIRGLSIGGWYADEINLHDREFVEEALRRSLASTDRRNMWTLNPDHPRHWIYTDYIDKFQGTPGFAWHHMTLADNPGISEKRREELAGQYSGFLYQRYIEGKRVAAEGACYPAFSPAMIVDAPRERIVMTRGGLDFGGGRSANAAACLGFSAGHRTIYLLDEYYDPVPGDIGRLKHGLKFFVERNRCWGLTDVYADSAEQMIIRELRGMGWGVNFRNALKTPVHQRVRLLQILMETGRFFVLRHCKATIGAISAAVYERDCPGEKRLDDGSSNIDSLDALEYALEGETKRLLFNAKDVAYDDDDDDW